MMLQFTKVGIEKPWRLTIILVRESRDPPAYEGIETTGSNSRGAGRFLRGRAIRPAYKGIETSKRYQRPFRG